MCDFGFKCITATIQIFLVLSTCGCNSRFSPPERLWVGKDGWAGLCRVMGRGGHSCPLYSSSRLSEFTHASISMYSSPTRARFDDLFSNINYAFLIENIFSFGLLDAKPCRIMWNLLQKSFLDPTCAKFHEKSAF